jgi:glucosamine kinase
MYTLIVDSGSTKTEWALIDGSGNLIKKVHTEGINPYFQSEQTIISIVQRLESEIDGITETVTGVHYYGTGCSSNANINILEHCLSTVFKNASISVAHDLLGAARALCGRQAGIAAILGTGSNSCLYDGSEILENVPSAGYLWSDYGGGSQIGKNFIREYFEGRLEPDLSSAFESAGYNRDSILDNVYKKDIPGRYLASVSLFIKHHISNAQVLKVLNECFDSFFIQQIAKYSGAANNQVHALGSIAFYYRPLIVQAAERHGFKMGKIIQSPMEGLIQFHSNRTHAS